MGRPRMIIVIRHAQSEGNRNRSIHQTVPDHRVKLTTEGQQQAEEAGRRLRSMLKPDDTLQFYTSPYRRTRETTDGILRTLTSDDPSPSPFPRQAIKVWEEPRIREQDFGNFQPCSAAMERMWQERADYGHFFYRIPDGESAADAYDRVSGFNESLWRSFSEDDFPSVCVLVTHGLMTRVFLMKWFHWSVEYFEDLRNVSHCEFVVMKRSADTGKYILQNELRTWSELKRKMVQDRKDRGLPEEPAVQSVPQKRWGGCPEGCTHEDDDYPKRPKRKETITARSTVSQANETQSSAPLAQNDGGKARGSGTAHPVSSAAASREAGPIKQRARYEDDEEAFPHLSHQKLQRSVDISEQDLPERLRQMHKPRPSPRSPKGRPQWLQAGRDAGGSESGASTPAPFTADAAGYGFPTTSAGAPNAEDAGPIATDKLVTLEVPERRRGSSIDQQQAIKDSGMGIGARADALGDQNSSEADDESGGDSANEVKRLRSKEKEDKSLRGSVY